jgi:hypothetical protein
LRRPARQHGVERDAARGAERRHHVAVRQRADDFDRRRGGQQFVAAQHGAQLLNALGRPAGQVGEGSVLGLAGLAVTLAQQDGGRRASVRDDGHIHAPTQSFLATACQPKLANYMTTNTSNIRSFQPLNSKSGQSSG